MGSSWESKAWPLGLDAQGLGFEVRVSGFYRGPLQVGRLLVGSFHTSPIRPLYLRGVV